MGFPGFPAAPMTLTLVVKLLASPDEVGLDRIVSLTYRLRGENQPIRHRQEVVVRPGANRMDEQAESGVIIIAMMGVLFEQPGIYEFGIETGNEVCERCHFTYPRPSRMQTKRPGCTLMSRGTNNANEH